MTETNVVYAIVHNQANPDDIRTPITSSLQPIFASRPREVVFDGYALVLRRRSMNRF